MGRINVSISEDLHNNLRIEKTASGTSVKRLVVEALEEKYGEIEMPDDYPEVESIQSTHQS